MNASPNPDDSAFFDTLMGEDELGVVVRAHIHLEAQIIKFIEAIVVHKAQLGLMNLEYSQKVHLAAALGLKEQYVAPLLSLGSMRNHFSHKPNMALTKNHVDNLYKSFSPDDKKVIQKAFVITNSKVPDTTRPNNFRGLAPKDQFILVCVTLRSMLIAAATAIHNEH